jgi:polysaccharide export outer membrane protein
MEKLTEKRGSAMKKAKYLVFSSWSFSACFLILSVFFLFPGQEPQQEEGYVLEYAIGPKDLLEIKVFDLPELNQTVRVAEDGTITLPLLGAVRVEGLSKNAVEARLKELLEEKWLENAQVSVFIKEYQSKRVALIGAVENPGMYKLVGKLTLLQVISEAGGFTENVSNEIFVLRNGTGEETATLVIDLEELLQNGNQKLNLPLQPGDVINVPVDTIICVYVFGAVGRPGALDVKKSKGISLLQAIAQAGGIAEGGSKSGVIIKRKTKEGKEIKLKVNIKKIIKGDKPDIKLQEGDVVYVSESIF